MIDNITDTEILIVAFIVVAFVGLQLILSIRLSNRR